jgi:trk system potassium uptake protein TrkH
LNICRSNSIGVRKDSYSIFRKEQLKKFFNRSPFILSCVAILIFLFDIGFNQSEGLEKVLDVIYIIIITFFAALVIARYLIFPPRKQRIRLWVIDLFLIALVLLIIFGAPYIGYFENPFYLYLLLFFIFIREFTTANLSESRKQINPALLFITSFLFLIITGTLLLMLPNATHSGISFIDAVFTSTSAVCVTGLIVVDTGSYFTSMGQAIILILIQLGGIGIMTFTSFFSYFFKGASSFEDQLMLRDITSSDKIAEVFSSLKAILSVTFLIEAIGALIIYISITDTIFEWSLDKIFFSIFHSISAFCNAGFSTLGNSLFESEFRFNYSLHLTIAFLFIIGGLGFPIVYNLTKLFRYLLHNALVRENKRIHKAWVVNINSKIIFITTFILSISGTILFYAFEYNNTLAEHNGWGKIVTSFFGAVTPRTAGFNSVDISALEFGTIMIIILLMWIGASPGSTGGGIKTTTFAIGTLNYLSLAHGKDRIEVFKREISQISVRRAFAAISLSLATIGMAVFCISIFDAKKDLLDIAFECFSAYSTVGLSLGITSSLSFPSKMVIIGTMFIGRVSMLTILVAFFRKVNTFQYRYPSEDILIN